MIWNWKIYLFNRFSIILSMIKFTDYMYDIAQNAFSACATKLHIKIIKTNHLRFTISDNGHGMTKEQIKQIASPFFTTRTTRNVGLGLPLIILLTQQTHGSYKVKSLKFMGTILTFTFNYHHLDFPSEGDLGLLIADLVSHQQLKHLTFSYKDNHHSFIWRYRKQQRLSIIKDINQKLKPIEVSNENIK